MLGLTVKQAKAMFFDRDVVSAVDKQTRRVLNRFGGFVRLTARRSMRPGGKGRAVSLPGEPPRSHAGHLKRLILYAYEPQQQSVIIGPAKFNGSKGRNVPQVLEQGGRSARAKPGGWHRWISIKARPYMGPAGDEGEKRLPGFWAESVKR